MYLVNHVYEPLLGVCLRCRRVREVGIYCNNETICEECQKIWLKIFKDASTKRPLVEERYGTIIPTEEFKKLRKEFLYGNNPSHRYGYVL